MATVEINLGETKLTAAQVKALADKFHKHTITLEYENKDLDLDGNFEDGTRWKSGLWESICAEIGLKGVKPKTLKSKVEDPTNCAVEIETWDQQYKGNIAFKAKAGDKTERVIKKNSKPPHVSVRAAGAKMGNCPYPDDLKDLLSKMGKTASYTYVGGSGSSKGWKPAFAGHSLHEQPGEGWKAYIDEPSMGNGSTWRLYFELDFNTSTKTLAVALTKVQEDH